MSETPESQAVAADERGREIQDQVEAAEAKSLAPKSPKATQAGAREYPVPAFPWQHQDKPGSEAALDP